MNDLFKFDKKNSAVLAVDCQNGFTERCPNELPVKGTNEKWIKELNSFIKLAKIEGYLIFASMDNHPEDHLSFKEWPKHCVKETFGNKLFLDDYNYLVKKGNNQETDSYSAFYEDFKTKKMNQLNDLLKENKIENLIILGLAGDVCVIATIKTALELNYNVYVVDKFIKSVSGKIIKEILEEENINSVKII